jgi:hypothetical protein
VGATRTKGSDVDCPLCDSPVDEVLINDDRACGECGHHWTPEEALAAA